MQRIRGLCRKAPPFTGEAFWFTWRIQIVQGSWKAGQG